MIRNGKLRHRVQLQKGRDTQDSRGGAIKTWDADQTVWAQVRPMLGKELEIARKMDGRATHKVKIRYYERLDNNFRIKHKSRFLYIISIVNIEELNAIHEIVAFEDV